MNKNSQHAVLLLDVQTLRATTELFLYLEAVAGHITAGAAHYQS